MNRKSNFPRDAESRVLEDALCLVFLEFQFAALADKMGEDKMINAVKKTWKKMTPAAQARALALPLGPNEKVRAARLAGRRQTGPILVCRVHPVHNIYNVRFIDPRFIPNS